MDVQVVADAVVFMAGLPLDANVQFLTWRRRCRSLAAAEKPNEKFARIRGAAILRRWRGVEKKLIAKLKNGTLAF
jgi:hypothetical protein